MTQIKISIARLSCWWFGHDPAYVDTNHTPCKRCEEYDIDFHTLVSNSRHENFKLCLKYYTFKKWVPDKCVDCGKRYGDHSQCIPF